jgi:hypothetical protein
MAEPQLKQKLRPGQTRKEEERKLCGDRWGGEECATESTEETALIRSSDTF